MVQEFTHADDNENDEEGSSELVMSEGLLGVGSEVNRLTAAEKSKRMQEQLKVGDMPMGDFLVS